MLCAWWVPPAAAADGDQCVPDSSTACIQGRIRTAGGDPAVGVTITVEGQGFTGEATTDDDGRWSVAVTADGEYTVTLDESTLPAGETLRNPADNPRTVVADLGATGAALFPLGSPTAAPSPGPSGSPSDPGTETTAPEDAEAGVEDSGRPGSITFPRVAQQFTSGIIFGLLLALASVGLSLIYGTTGLSSFSHGEQVTLGALAAYVFAQLMNMPLLLAGVLAVLVGALSGYAQDAGIWKPLRKRGMGPVQLMIITIGLSMALQYSFQFFFGGGRMRITIATPTSINVGGVIIAHQSILSTAIALLALGGVAYFLQRTWTGRATRAVADNPALAAASGINVERIIRLVWVVGAGLAALGGVLIGLYFNVTSWNMGGTILLLMFAAVTLGGLGTAFGALVGSIVIGLVAEMSSLVIPSDLRYAGALVILILVLLVRPQGILGRAERIG
ncbi:MAG: branched-chain amino acid ABC transporter permease [Actinomycetales bacterium]|nr:branched-chain amino acid ABC transporter permease [Actinomycetales bacterium]